MKNGIVFSKNLNHFFEVTYVLLELKISLMINEREIK